MCHACPVCGQMCYCDWDDTYLGEDIPEGCPHENCEIQSNEDEELMPDKDL